MKSFTDIEQSTELAKILPLESADMFWANGERPAVWNNKDISLDETDIPCWSLAALVAILPISCDDGQHCFALITPNPNDATEWLCCYEDSKGDLLNECYADNPIGACVELILKLHKQKLL